MVAIGSNKVDIPVWAPKLATALLFTGALVVAGINHGGITTPHFGSDVISDDIQQKLIKRIGGQSAQNLPLIVDELSKQGVTDKGQIAYVLATVTHETGIFAPVYEKGQRSYFNKYAGRMGNRNTDDAFNYRGRGFVQLTGRNNYTRYGIADNPDKALEPAKSAFILVDGMKKGIFTGHKLGDHIQGNRQDFTNARRIVNGMDKAQTFAGTAKEYLRIIEGK